MPPKQGEANPRIPVRPDLPEKPGRLLTTHTVTNMPVRDLHFDIGSRNNT